MVYSERGILYSYERKKGRKDGRRKEGRKKISFPTRDSKRWKSSLEHCKLREAAGCRRLYRVHYSLYKEEREKEYTHTLLCICFYLHKVILMAVVSKLVCILESPEEFQNIIPLEMMI